MSDGKAVGKRKRQAIAEDEDHCTRLHAELTLLINKRVQDVNAYVAKRLQKLKGKEAKIRRDHQDQLTSIEEREGALSRRIIELNARAEEMQQKEGAIDTKSAELQSLHAQLVPLYDKLQSELPELQARASLACELQPNWQSAATPGEKNGCWSDPHLHFGCSDPQLSEQQLSTGLAHVEMQTLTDQSASVDVTGVSGQMHEAAAAAQSEVHHGSDGIAEASSSAEPSRGEHGRSARQDPRTCLPEAPIQQQQHACNTRRPSSSFADVELLGNAAPGQCEAKAKAAYTQQAHEESNSQPAMKAPEHEGCASQIQFRPVVQQRRAVPAQHADSPPVLGSTGRGPAAGARKVTRAARTPRAVPTHTPSASQGEDRTVFGQLPQILSSCKQSAGKAITQPHRLSRTGCNAARGEVDELDGLVSSLRAQCPVTDNLAQSGAMQGGAASLGNGHDAQQAHAETPVSCLQVSADLIVLLKAQHTFSSSALIQTGSDASAAAETALYKKVHAILNRCMSHQPAGQDDEAEPDEAAHHDSSSPRHSSKHALDANRRYSITALEILKDAAEQYQANGEPVTWGWCKELEAFVFVFETANRIVVEKTKREHATYFFEIEEPLAVSCQVEWLLEVLSLLAIGCNALPHIGATCLPQELQDQRVQRLIAVLSVPSIGRNALLHNGATCLPMNCQEEDMAVLKSAGWTEDNGLRALLNFSGERVLHMNDKNNGACNGESWEWYRKRLRRILSEGRANGRLHKAAKPSSSAEI